MSAADDLPSAASFNVSMPAVDYSKIDGPLWESAQTWQDLVAATEQAIDLALAQAKGSQMALTAGIVQAIDKALGEAQALHLTLASDADTAALNLLASAWEHAASIGALPSSPTGQQPYALYKTAADEYYVLPATAVPNNTTDALVSQHATQADAQAQFLPIQTGPTGGNGTTDTGGNGTTTIGPGGGGNQGLGGGGFGLPCPPGWFIDPVTGQCTQGGGGPGGGGLTGNGTCPPGMMFDPELNECIFTGGNGTGGGGGNGTGGGGGGVGTTCPLPQPVDDLTPALSAVPGSNLVPAGGQILWPDWNSTAVCDQLQQFATQDITQAINNLPRMLGLIGTDDGGNDVPVTPAWLQGLNTIRVPDVMIAPASILQAIMDPAGTLQVWSGILLGGTSPEPPGTGTVTIGFGDVAAATLRLIVSGLVPLLTQYELPKTRQAAIVLYYRTLSTVLQLLASYVKVDLSDIVKTIEYARAYFSPTAIPDAGTADACYYADAINSSLWECWTRANDVLPGPAQIALWAGRSKLNVDQAMNAYYRGYINQATAAEKIRQQGYIDPADVSILTQLTVEIPSPTQAVDWSVGQLFSDPIVSRYQLDQGAEQLGAAPFDAWIKAGGLDPALLQGLWRAHWTFPGAATALEAVRRLRPGRVDDSIVTTPDDASYAMQRAAIAPYWQPRLAALAVRPLMYRQATMAYEHGALDEQGFTTAMLDSGFSADAAATLLASAQAQTVKAVLASPFVRHYRDGGLNRAAAEGSLRAQGFPAGPIATALTLAEGEFVAEVQASGVKALHKRYLQGDLGIETMRGMLLQRGLDADYVNTLLNGWASESAARGKVVNASELGKLYDEGLITPVDMMTRLMNLGYSLQDATQILKMTQAQLSRRQAARAAALAAAQQRQQARQLAGQQRTEKQQVATLKAQAAAANRRQVIADRKAKRRVSIIGEWAKVQGWDEATAAANLTGYLPTIEGTYQLTEDQAWDVASVAWHRIPKGGTAGWKQVINDAAAAEEGLLAGMGNGAGGGAGAPGG